MAVEQVFYTWAKKGLAGHGMLQPVRTSAGFSGLDERHRKLAMTLCQYDAGTAAKKGYPASMGWIDQGSTRFAFSRIFLRDPALQAGRPGNFAAHVAIGPASQLPVRDLLSRFLLGLWWQGPLSSDDLALPESPDWPKSPRTARPHAGMATAEAILSSLLEGRHPIRSDANPDELMAALNQILKLLPQALNGFSVSTFEGPRMAAWFDIAGSQSAMRTPLIPEARYLLDQPAAADWLPALHPKDDPHRARELAEVRAWISVSHDLVAGKAQPESIARILRLPQLVPRALSGFPALTGALAGAVTVRDRTVLQALLSAGPGIPVETLREIGHEVGGLVAATEVERVHAALAKMPAAFHDGCARAVVRRADLLPYVQRWSDATIDWLLGAALERSSPPAARAAVEARLVQVGRPASLLARSLSSQSRSALFAALCRRWTGPWGLSATELGMVLAEVGTQDADSLSMFFGSPSRDELEIRIRALAEASPTWQGPLRLTSAATRRVLMGASSGGLPSLLAALDLAVLTSPAESQFLEQVVLELLETYERDAYVVLPLSFWTALAGNPATAPYALAHAGRRLDGQSPLAALGRAARVADFLEFEARALASNASHISSWVKSVRSRELRWLVVTTLRGARAGAPPTWVLVGLEVVYQHSRLWLPSQFGRAIRLGSDPITMWIEDLTRYVAQMTPQGFASFRAAQPDDTRLLLRGWGL